MWPGFNSRRRRYLCGLSLLLVLSLAPRGFSPGTPVFPSPQKPTLPNSNSIWNARTRLNEFIWTPMCFVGKQLQLQLFTIFLQFYQRDGCCPSGWGSRLGFKALPSMERVSIKELTTNSKSSWVSWAPILPQATRFFNFVWERNRYPINTR